MKDKSLSVSLRSFIAFIVMLVMMMSMAVYVVADEEGEETADETTGEVTTEESTEASENYKPAETVTPEGYDNETQVSLVGFHRDGRYVDYYAEYASYDVALGEIVVEGDAVDSATGKYTLHDTFEGKKSVLEMNEVGDLTYRVNVTNTGLYALKLDYYPLIGDGNGKDYELSILIDGKLPHDDADRFTLKRNWGDEDEVRQTDSIGNELYSKQVEKLKWLSKDVRDPDGVFDDAVKFYLTAGEHTITFSFATGVLAFDTICLYNYGTARNYESYIAEHGEANVVDQSITLEAESYVDKSESLIQPAYDRSDPKVSPYSISKTKMNVFGGENWNTNGQVVNWKFEVPETGYYTIGVRFRQSYVEDSVSYRRIYIDGEVPFNEANMIGFPFGIGYQYQLLGTFDEKGKTVPYKFYLEKGTHEFSMESVIGSMAEVSRRAEDIVYQLNYIYRKIIIVTGTDPDTYRDYELDTKISDLKEMLSSVLNDLKTVEKNVIDINGSLGSATILTTLNLQLEDFVEKPYTIPDRLSTFKDNISTLSSWMLDLRDQPLQVDKILFIGEESKVASQKANLWENLTHEVRAFWSSFVDDYTSVGSPSTTGRSISAWVGTGRDQAMVLKTLCDNYFTPQHDISVNVGLVPLGILSKAIIAGRGPDIALHVSRSEPMNLGIRGAVYDISQFDNYEELVTSRFSSYAMTPYTLSTTDENGKAVNKVFALPETQNFNMMFYRTDIFAELGIEAPNTWDEFDNILPYIQANNMTVGLDSHLAETAPTTGGAFYTYILQSGTVEDPNLPVDVTGAFTNFTEQYAINAFQKWTRYYLQYDLPTDYSWYTRFRNGEMPLVLQTYSNITYLQESAPELNGLWEAVPIPGTIDENGNMNRSEESTGMSACMIVERTIQQADDPEQQLNDAWQFMDWWTSDDITADYGNRVEMAIGSVARYTTSNINAFEKIKWSVDEANAIREQRKFVREIPELIGGYYVGRNLINAFRNVTNNHSNPREKLFYYNEQINDEIWRKRSEYHYSVPEEAKK